MSTFKYDILPGVLFIKKNKKTIHPYKVYFALIKKWTQKSPRKEK